MILLHINTALQALSIYGGVLYETVDLDCVCTVRTIHIDLQWQQILFCRIHSIKSGFMDSISMLHSMVICQGMLISCVVI